MPNTMSHIMKTVKKEVAKTEVDAEESESQEEEETDKTTDEESAEDTESEESDDASDEEDDSDDSSSKTEELDLDAELEKERKAGEPDPAIAEKAFKDRKNKREDPADEEVDRPLTQKDLDAALAADRKERQRDDALVIAKEMAGSDKEAQLIVAKWGNRTFPKGLTLKEQIQEAYVITHSKKLIGERNEALRGLKGRRGINNNPATGHKDPLRGGSAPKVEPSEVIALRQSGFVFNNVTRRYEKKLPSGKTLIRDNKTKQVRLLAKGQ